VRTPFGTFKVDLDQLGEGGAWKVWKARRMTEYTALSWSVQSLIRNGFALCTLGMLFLSIPGARRFFGTAKYGGYANDEPVLNILFSPIGRVVLLAGWVASACWLLLDKHTVLAAFICLVLSRFCFISLRWRSISRGMGAPGFMLYWLAGLVFFLEYTRFYDPSGYLRSVAILAFKIDFAVIMLCAGQYKLFSGYPQNNGMERGMVNPWWGRLRDIYRPFPPTHPVFKFLNHCAYLGELVAGAAMLYAPWSEAGGLFMAFSFIIIFVHIKLGFLCHTVMVSCLLFCFPGGWVDSLLPSVAAPQGVEGHFLLTVVNTLLSGFLIVYVVLLPFVKLGTYYNFYGKKRLPEKWQAFQDKWTNLFGIIIWRVFTIDNTNFYVNAYLEDRKTGERTLYSKPGLLEWSKGLRYNHVCEFVCFVSIFTTLKYFPSNSPLFTEKLLRYARTIPCSDHQVLVFEWVDIKKESDRFTDVASKEYRVDLLSEELTVINLADGTSETDSLRFSDLHEGHKVGSYAPPSR